MPGGQVLQAAVGLAVELHEDQVPDLDHLGVVGVHQLRSGSRLPLGLAADVHVDLRARTAGAGVAHLPEVVLPAEGHDPFLRQVLLPQVAGLGVGFQTISLITAEVGHVQPVGVDLEGVHQQFPRPLDGLGLEVVAEAPVAEHLEHGVVVGVDAHLLQVVVLPADPQALLGVGHAPVGRLAVPQEDVLEGVHPRIGEHQGGVVLDHHGCAGHDAVVALREVVQEGLADLVGCHDRRNRPQKYRAPLHRKARHEQGPSRGWQASSAR